MQTIANSQSTLKIYVANDDSRSDMDIIDLNTSALDRYGQSVDSTNINFYTTTMSTQVLRMNRLDLFGPEEVKATEVSAEEKMNIEPELGGNATGSNIVTSQANVLRKENKTELGSRTASFVTRTSSRATAVTQRPPKSKRKQRHSKKTRKIKKYKGQCPRFF